jgi:hypothetical protein
LQSDLVSRFDEEKEGIFCPLISNKNGSKPTPYPINFPPAKLGAARSLLEGMLADDENNEELTAADRRAIQIGLDSLEKHGTVSMEEVLADFGLSIADFDEMSDERDPLPTTKRHG